MTRPTLTAGNPRICQACLNEFMPDARVQKYCYECSRRLLDPRRWAIQLRRRIAEMEAH